jgi:hypothetical protein
MYTKGPWHWEANSKTHSVDLRSSKGMGYIVMDFVRWGMNGAQPAFLDNKKQILVKAQSLLRPRKEHHPTFDLDINHPDARLIAAAPDLYEALERLIDLLDSEEPITVGCHCTDTDTGHGTLVCCWCKSKAALQKAKGQ